jgi:hypothetical protein
MIMKTKIHILAVTICCMSFTANAQQQDDQTQKFTPKEFSIPASPVFDLMGVTPSQVNKFNEIKNFKVDWSFKSWRLSPNLAIQAQPIWELFYNKKSLRKYQSASRFQRMLSTLDASIGTVQDEAGNRRIGFSGKLNVFRRVDPLMYTNLYLEMDSTHFAKRIELDSTLKAYRKELDTVKDVFQKPALRQKLQTVQDELLALQSQRVTNINNIIKTFILEDWNKAYLDIAWGQVFTYVTDSAGSLRKLKLDRNTANAIWINGGIPIGKRFMLTGLARVSNYREEVTFSKEDILTGDISTDTVTAKNNLFTLGLNFRYGSPKYSFFIEGFVDLKSIKKPSDIIGDRFKNQPNLKIVEPTINWTVVDPYIFTFGGDWRISNNLSINYGMRCIIDKNGKLNTFTPIVNISCLMR